MMLWRLIGLVMLPLPALGAGDLVYLTDMHRSEWHFSGSRVICDLSHQINEYGTAHFYQQAGGKLGFRIDSLQAVHKKSTAVMLETLPPWVEKKIDWHTEQVAVNTGMQPIRLDYRQSAWLLNTLDGGRYASFDFRDWESSKYNIRVSLNTVKFRTAYAEFRSCTNALLPYTFDDIRLSELRFPTNVHKLSKNNRRQLERLVTFIKETDEPIEVTIKGHADSIHTRRYNRTLSARRADSVYDYLVKSGVPKERVRKIAYGEKRPKASNKTASGRAVNRRVEVTLNWG